MSGSVDEYDNPTTPLRRHGIDPDSIAVGPSGTIVDSWSDDVPFSTAELPLIQLEPCGDGDDHVRISLGATVGQGGTGIVSRAQQVALHRQVAVKRLRQGTDEEEGARQLWREALVTGKLQHPNIVPIHVLGRTASGSPLLVMKYIEGNSWLELLRSREHPLDDLDTHLQILMQVCRALHFAHLNGIVHRDVKPSNVIISAGHEVYLVDWGLAVAYRWEEGDLLRKTRDVTSLEGTPGYLAPEMVKGDGAHIDPRTDVYLLGSVLHQVLTGTLRHKSKTLGDSLRMAVDSKPIDYGEDIPTELASICNKATHKSPAQRHADVESFRAAIEAYRRHDASRHLAAEAASRLQQLETQLAAAGKAADPKAYQLAIEARFGFQQALEQWTGNEAARLGLQQVIELLVSLELQRENADAADALLAELDQPPAALSAQLAALRESLARRAEDLIELKRRRDATDLQLNLSARRRILLVFGTLLAATFIGMTVAHNLGVYEVGYPDMIGILVVFGAAVVAALYVARNSGNTALNRLRVTVLLVTVAQILLLVSAMRFDMDLSPTVVIAMLINAAASGCAAVLIDRRYMWASVTYLITFGLLLVWPLQAGIIVAVGTLVAVASTSLALRLMRSPTP